MILTEAIPRVIRSELTLRGWTITKLGLELIPPANVDVAAKKIRSAGWDLRRLAEVCKPLGLTVGEVIAKAEKLEAT